MKSLMLSIALIAAAVVFPAPAHAGMLIGNYELQTPRDPGHSWIWAVRPCQVRGVTDCVHVQGVPRPNGQAVPYDGDAFFANGRYTMAIESEDGVRCGFYFKPSHDTWVWDAGTLGGSVESRFDAGCGNDPGGSVTYPFSLVRY